MVSVQELEKIASQIRRDIVRQVHLAQSGHPGGSLGCADLFTALYFEVMDLKEGFNMSGQGEDVFYLSNGHISPVWYSTLARKGYFPIEELATFRQINTRLQGHPTTHEHLPGVRVASGSLGQGLSVAIGNALGKKLKKDNHVVYCLCGDGELQEGQIWEAALFGAHHKVDNLIAIVDLNFQQIDGPTEEIMSTRELDEKFAAFGWDVLTCDGNDMTALLNTLQGAKQNCHHSKPQVILMRTEMGKGVDFMEGSHTWHGIAPNDEQLSQALDQLEKTLGDFPIKN